MIQRELSESQLNRRVQQDIAEVASRHHAERVVLFGSRARGENMPKSDIDLAVYGCRDMPAFSEDIENTVWTLLYFDLIDMDQPVSRELRHEIERDGIVIYNNKRQ